MEPLQETEPGRRAMSDAEVGEVFADTGAGQLDQKRGAVAGEKERRANKPATGSSVFAPASVRGPATTATPLQPADDGSDAALTRPDSQGRYGNAAPCEGGGHSLPGY